MNKQSMFAQQVLSKGIALSFYGLLGSQANQIALVVSWSL